MVRPNPKLQVKVNLKSREKCDIFRLWLTCLLSARFHAAVGWLHRHYVSMKRRASSSPSVRARATVVTNGSCCAKIAFIVFAQRIGMTLDEIAAGLAKLPEGRR